MTTAHRPTWKAAVGRADEGGFSVAASGRSALDAPAHLTLKVRKGHQKVNRETDLQASLEALKQAEANAADKTKKRSHQKQLYLQHRRAVTRDKEAEERSQQRLLKQTAEVDDVRLKEKYDDEDVRGGDDSDRDEDESDLDASSSSDDDESSDDEDESDEDEEAALQAELAKIRAERSQAQRRAEEREAAAETAKQEEAALLGNPLLASSDSGSIGSVGGGRLKRRWNDDVVFRHQAKGEPTPKKRFINDTVRNDFHKRFLNKFIR